MIIPVVWLSYRDDTPPRGYWDQAIIEGLLSGDLWRPSYAYEFAHYKAIEDAGEGCVIVFPARAQVDYLDQLNNEIKNLKWVLIMLTGDEEASFPFEKIEHPNMRLYVMSPRRQSRYDNVRFLGTGFAPLAPQMLPTFKDEANNRTTDYFFAGQITHERRTQMAEQIAIMEEFRKVNNLYGDCVYTKGFTEGLRPAEYYRRMAKSKVAFAPSGPETPDTFRLFEALEAGCIPIADTRVSSNKNNADFGDDYWTFFFGEEPPFVVLKDYDQLQGFTIDAVEKWKPLSNKIFSWWMKIKRQWAVQLHNDIEALIDDPNSRNTEDVTNTITILIPTSPIPAHPSTEMIETTIADVRAKLPNSEIILMIDGIRPEQADRQEDYEEYIHRLLWLCHHEWHNVLPLLFNEHTHQASMTREALNYVDTPIILFVEHDAPLTPDRDFDWRGLCISILKGEANLIRFHHEALILPEHESLMMSEVIHVCGVPMRKTMQWSQRPHLASTAFYRRFIEAYFHPESKTMIEDVMHGIVHTDCMRDGLMGWNNWRLWIYTPEGDIKRSYHLDGRQDDPKYEMIIKKVEGR